MNRETIFAIVFGILLGVGVGIFVLFQTNQGDKTKVIPVAQETNAKQVAKTSATPNQTLLKITTPENNTVMNEKEITIKGQAPKNSLLVVQSPVGNQVFKNEKEDFSITFPLALGENIINISDYSTSSSPQEATLQIYYVEE